jgi:hypothetical protein
MVAAAMIVRSTSLRGVQLLVHIAQHLLGLQEQACTPSVQPGTAMTMMTALMRKRRKSGSSGRAVPATTAVMMTVIVTQMTQMMTSLPCLLLLPAPQPGA